MFGSAQRYVSRSEDAELELRVLQDPSPKVRVSALRVAEPLLADPAVARAIMRLATDPDFEVRRQLVFTLGEGRGAAFEDALVELVRADWDRPVVVEAALSGLTKPARCFTRLRLSGWACAAARLGF